MTCPEKDLLKSDFCVKAQLLIHVLAEQGLLVLHPLLEYESNYCYISFDEFYQIFEVLHFYEYWAVNGFLFQIIGKAFLGLIRSKCGCQLYSWHGLF